MMPGLIYDNPFEYFTTLILDLLIFHVKAIFYFLETVYLTLLPRRLRKLKVKLASTNFSHFISLSKICVLQKYESFES